MVSKSINQHCPRYLFVFASIWIITLLGTACGESNNNSTISGIADDGAATDMEWSKFAETDTEGNKYATLKFPGIYLRIPESNATATSPNAPVMQAIVRIPNTPSVGPKSSNYRGTVRISFVPTFSRSIRPHRDTYLSFEKMQLKGELSGPAARAYSAGFDRYNWRNSWAFFISTNSEYTTPGGNPLVVWCSWQVSEDQGPNLCIVEIEWSSLMTVRYEFEMNLLNEYFEIHQAATDFIKLALGE